MAHFWRKARTGSWLTRQRVAVYSAMLLVGYVIAVLAMVVTSPDGRTDIQGRPLGTDFSNVYAAGTYVLDGQAAAAFDPNEQEAREKIIFGEAAPFYGWHYPPFFLGLAAVFALLPYAAALLVWQAASFAAYLVAIRGSLGEAAARLGHWWLPAAAFPAVFVNLGHGHNGFLTTALLASGLTLLDRRPIVAGILIGLLAYKPQFGLLIPIVLLATGRWQVMAAAAATVAAMVGLSLLAWGWAVWQAFFAFSDFTRVAVLENGGTGWEKIQTVFSAMRMWGGSVDLAYAVQGAVSVALAVALAVMWRSAADMRLKSAALCVAAVIGTPYSLDYDMMVLAAALAFVVAYWVERGAPAWAITLAAFVWVVPLVARGVAMVTFVPIGMLSIVGFFVAICVWSGVFSRSSMPSNFFTKPV